MPTIDLRSRIARPALLLSLILAGCGGGGDGGGGPASLTVGGTAATGAALAGAAVDVRCARGSGNTTTASDGRFSVTMADAARPCALRVAANGNSLYSLVSAGNAASATANLTPLSDLLVARVASGAPQTMFDAFDSAAQAKATPSRLASALVDIRAALQPVVDLSGLDPVAGDASVGGALDGKLDQLVAALAAKSLTLDDLITAVATGSTDAAKRLLQPVATGCEGLRSGPMRVIAGSQSRASGVTQFDATTLSYTLPDGRTGTLSDNGSCSYSNPDGTLLLSRSGFAAFVTAPTASDPASHFLPIIPEQTIGLDELAGTWNYVIYTVTPASPQQLTPANGYFTLDAAGRFSGHFACVGLNPCSSGDALADLTVDAAGGFDWVNADRTDHLYDFKTAQGQHMLVAILEKATFGYLIATKQSAGRLPAVGEVTQVRSFTVDPSLVASAIQDSSYTVIAVDSAAQTFTRQRAQDGRIETFTIDSPRAGLSTRAAGTGVAPIVSLRLPGSASSAFTSLAPTQNFFGIGIQHP